MTTATMNYASAGTLTFGMTNPSSDTTLLIGRQSTSVDNETSVLALDYILGGHFAGPSTGAAAGFIEVWAYGSWDGGSTFTATCTGTDGALTLVAATKSLLRGPVEIITTNTTNSQAYKWGPVALAEVFRGQVPSDWGLWGVQSSGGALTASTTKYQAIKVDSA